MSNDSKTAVVRDLEFHYPKVVNPSVNPNNNVEQWELQVRTPSEEKRDELEALGVNFKKEDFRDPKSAYKLSEDGQYMANVKRKTTSNKGEAMKPPLILGADKMPLEDPSNIGNGSKGAIKVFSYYYKNPMREGWACILSAVMVTDLVIYEGGDNPAYEDF